MTISEARRPFFRRRTEAVGGMLGVGLLAGGANVVMQLAWPGVGYGVVESKVDSGALMKHPWKRARTTFQYIAVAVIGCGPMATSASTANATATGACHASRATGTAGFVDVTRAG